MTPLQLAAFGMTTPETVFQPWDFTDALQSNAARTVVVEKHVTDCQERKDRRRVLSA